MDEYNTRVLLSKLPPRVNDVASRPSDCTPSFPQSSAVEAVGREIVEQVDAVDVADPALGPALLEVMQQLEAARVTSPVSLAALKAVVLPAALKREKRVYAKLLRCLNGAAVPLVSPRQLFHAMSRERAVAASELGWDSSEAITTFASYTCSLLLQSVGVNKEVLPPVKPVPSAVKLRINSAWQAACAAQSWPCVL